MVQIFTFFAPAEENVKITTANYYCTRELLNSLKFGHV